MLSEFLLLSIPMPALVNPFTVNLFICGETEFLGNNPRVVVMLMC